MVVDRCHKCTNQRIVKVLTLDLGDSALGYSMKPTRSHRSWKIRYWIQLEAGGTGISRKTANWIRESGGGSWMLCIASAESRYALH